MIFQVGTEVVQPIQKLDVIVPVLVTVGKTI